MLTSLDPHSGYMDAEEFKEMQAETHGEFGGLGIEVTMEEGLIKVWPRSTTRPPRGPASWPTTSSPQIDGEPVQGMTLNQAVEKMRGPVGTSVKLDDPAQGEARADRGQARPARSSSIRPVRAHARKATSATCASPSSTSRPTPACETAIEEIATRNRPGQLKGYVLDLRNNPGGLLDQAVLVSDAFLDPGRDRLHPRPQRRGDAALRRASPGSGRRQAAGGADQRRLGVGVRDRRGRAAGPPARDRDGHALVRQRLGADDHPARRRRGALRLTTARYYTPSGRSIQAKGIEPDQEVLQEVPDELKGEDETKGEAGLPGHLKNSARTRRAVHRPTSRRTRPTTSS